MRGQKYNHLSTKTSDLTYKVCRSRRVLSTEVKGHDLHNSKISYSASVIKGGSLSSVQMHTVSVIIELRTINIFIGALDKWSELKERWLLISTAISLSATLWRSFFSACYWQIFGSMNKATTLGKLLPLQMNFLPITWDKRQRPEIRMVSQEKKNSGYFQ